MPAFCQDKLDWLSPIEFKQEEETHKMPVLDEPVVPMQCNNCNCDPTLADRLKALEEKYNTLEKEHNEVYASYKRHLAKLKLEASKPKTTSVPAKPLLNNVVAPVAPILVNKIIVHTSKRCGPCQAWLKNEYPKFVAAGWIVEFVDHLFIDRNLPHYVITRGTIPTYEHTGYLPFETVNR